MAIWFLLKEMVVLIFFCGVSSLEEEDLLENLKIKRDDPPELLNFLQSVLEQKDEFKKIRDADRRIQAKTANAANTFFDQDVFSDVNYDKQSNYLPQLQDSLLMKRSPHYSSNQEAQLNAMRPVNDIFPYTQNENEFEDESDPNVSNFYERVDRHNKQMRQKQRKRKRSYVRFRRGLDLSDYSSFNDFGSNSIKIFPRSQVGVQKVPGKKFSWSRPQSFKKHADGSRTNHNLYKNIALNNRNNNKKLGKIVNNRASQRNNFFLKMDNREDRAVNVHLTDKNNAIKNNNNILLTTEQNALEDMSVISIRNYDQPQVDRNIIRNLVKSKLKKDKYIKHSYGVKLQKNNNKGNNNNKELVKPWGITKEVGGSEENKVQNDDSTQQKVTSLEDVDEPTSAIEQYKLSTRPIYMTLTGKTDDKVSGAGFESPIAAFLFTVAQNIPEFSDKLLKYNFNINSNEITTVANKPLFQEKENKYNPLRPSISENSNANKFGNYYNIKQKNPYADRVFNYQNILQENNPSGVIEVQNEVTTEQLPDARHVGDYYYQELPNFQPVKQHFQTRNLQYLHETADSKEAVKNSRYGYLDYENGQHNDLIDENKIRVKRSYPALFNINDDEFYLDQAAGDYKEPLNKEERSEDDYEEEEDPVVLKKVAYDKKKNVKTQFSNKYNDCENGDSKYPVDEVAELPTSSRPQCMFEKKIQVIEDKPTSLNTNNPQTVKTPEPLLSNRTGRNTNCDCNSKTPNTGCNCKNLSTQNKASKDKKVLQSEYEEINLMEDISENNKVAKPPRHNSDKKTNILKETKRSQVENQGSCNCNSKTPNAGCNCKNLSTQNKASKDKKVTQGESEYEEINLMENISENNEVTSKAPRDTSDKKSNILKETKRSQVENQGNCNCNSKTPNAGCNCKNLSTQNKESKDKKVSQGESEYEEINLMENISENNEVTSKAPRHNSDKITNIRKETKRSQVQKQGNKVENYNAAMLKKNKEKPKRKEEYTLHKNKKSSFQARTNDTIGLKAKNKLNENEADIIKYVKYKKANSTTKFTTEKTKQKPTEAFHIEKVKHKSKEPLSISHLKSKQNEEFGIKDTQHKLQYPEQSADSDNDNTEDISENIEKTKCTNCDTKKTKPNNENQVTATEGKSPYKFNPEEITEPKTDKDRVNSNHKENPAYYHHPSKTRKPHNNKMKGSKTTLHPKSQLREILTRYHTKYNENEFRQDNYNNAIEESPEVKLDTGALNEDYSVYSIDNPKINEEVDMKKAQMQDNTNEDEAPPSQKKEKINSGPEIHNYERSIRKGDRAKKRRSTERREKQDYQDDSYAEFSLHSDKIRNDKLKNGDITTQSILHLNDIRNSVSEPTTENTNNTIKDNINNNAAIKNLLNSVESFADIVEDNQDERNVFKRESVTSKKQKKKKRKMFHIRHRHRRNSNLMYIPFKHFPKLNRQVYLKKRSKHKKRQIQIFNKDKAHTALYPIPLKYKRKNFMSGNESPENPSDNSKKHLKECQPVKDDGKHCNLKQWINAKGKNTKNNKQGTDNTSSKEKCPKDSGQMADVVSGHLASEIVDSIIKGMKTHPNLNGRFSTGLHRTHDFKNEIKDLNTFRNNETENEIKHTEDMLQEMMSVMNEIILDQVTKRTCKVLSPELKDYLSSIVKLNTTAEDNDDSRNSEGVPLLHTNSSSKKEQKSVNPKQGDFLFFGMDGKSDLERDEGEIKKRIVMVRGLLAKYRSMSDNCKIKVRNVETYLRKHLGMLQNMLHEIESEKNKKEPKIEADHPCSKPKRKYDDSSYSFFFNNENKQKQKHIDHEPSRGIGSHNYHVPQDLVNKQLDSIGLGPTKRYRPPFNVNRIVQDSHIKLQENKDQPSILGSQKETNSHLHSDYQDVIIRDNFDDDKSHSGHKRKRKAPQIEYEDQRPLQVSGQYKKLAEAADHLRKKKEIEERLGKLFGQTEKRSSTNKNYETINSRNRDTQELSKVEFEKPMVFSLDR